MTDKLSYPYPLSPQTAELTKRYLARPGTVLLITGLPGAGKYGLSRSIAANLLKSPEDKLQNLPNFKLLSPGPSASEISIDEVRQLKHQLNLKPSTGRGVRVVLIDQAHKLSLEAQNAALKLLEEPPTDSHFILTAPSGRSLLPTITSRSWILPMLPVSLSAAQEYFGPVASAREVERAWRLSGGSVGLLAALLDDEDEHVLKVAVERAKQFLAASRYQRLVIADSLAGKSEEIELLLLAMSKVVSVLHHRAIEQGKRQQRDLLAARQLLVQLSQQLELRANPRLTGLNLALKLKV